MPLPGNTKRVTIFAGHYGSGKTNIALNWARRLKSPGVRVAVADLDIVNPYFRTQDSAALLEGEGIELVVSPYANSNVDFPAMPKEIYSLVAERDLRVVMDVGGDDRGALALGRYVDDIRQEGDYEMLAVVNGARPLTSTVEATVEVLREVESAARLDFTGIVNNTNLGPETTVETVLDSREYADGVAETMGIPMRFTCVRTDLAAELGDGMGAILPLEIQRLYYQIGG